MGWGPLTLGTVTCSLRLLSQMSPHLDTPADTPEHCLTKSWGPRGPVDLSQIVKGLQFHD